MRQLGVRGRASRQLRAQAREDLWSLGRSAARRGWNVLSRTPGGCGGVRPIASHSSGRFESMTMLERSSGRPGSFLRQSSSTVDRNQLMPSSGNSVAETGAWATEQERRAGLFGDRHTGFRRERQSGVGCAECAPWAPVIGSVVRTACRRAGARGWRLLPRGPAGARFLSDGTGFQPESRLSGG